MGSWLNYGLGSESDDLPGFVVLTSLGKFGQAQPIAARQWHSGFLPSRFQGVEFHSKGDPVLYLGNPAGRRRRPPARRGRRRPARSTSSRTTLVDDPEIATRIAAYEMAFRMQASVPELMDVSGEPRHMLDMYGTAGGRRLVRGQLPAGPPPGRARRAVHPALPPRLGPPRRASRSTSTGPPREVDQGAAALIKDLKQRGMLDDTLVVWGGEFGRTPMAQGRRPRPPHQGLLDVAGRRRHQAGHHLRRHRRVRLQRRRRRRPRPRPARHDAAPASASTTLRLTYRFQGRDFRLTDVAGKVVKAIMG